MRLLIVSRDPAHRRSLQENLQAECYITDQSESVRQALKLAREREYDLLISQHHEHQLHTNQLLSSIRAAQPSLPCLVITVHTDLKTHLEILEAGADDLLVKPYSFMELSARLRALIRRPRLQTEQLLTAGDITMNQRKQLVFWQSQELYMTRKEYQLLEFLLEHKDEIVTRAQLYDQVWDKNTDPFSNTIEAHVRSLRRKLEDHTKKDIILTVPGRGYRLIDRK